MDYPKVIVSNQKEESISIERVNFSYSGEATEEFHVVGQ